MCNGSKQVSILLFSLSLRCRFSALRLTIRLRSRKTQLCLFSFLNSFTHPHSPVHTHIDTTAIHYIIVRFDRRRKKESFTCSELNDDESPIMASKRDKIEKPPSTAMTKKCRDNVQQQQKVTLVKMKSDFHFNCPSTDKPTARQLIESEMGNDK